VTADGGRQTTPPRRKAFGGVAPESWHQESFPESDGWSLAIALRLLPGGIFSLPLRWRGVGSRWRGRHADSRQGRSRGRDIRPRFQACLGSLVGGPPWVAGRWRRRGWSWQAFFATQMGREPGIAGVSSGAAWEGRHGSWPFGMGPPALLGPSRSAADPQGVHRTTAGMGVVLAPGRGAGNGSGWLLISGIALNGAPEAGGDRLTALDQCRPPRSSFFLFTLFFFGAARSFMDDGRLREADGPRR